MQLGCQPGTPYNPRSRRHVRSFPTFPISKGCLTSRDTNGSPYEVAGKNLHAFLVMFRNHYSEEPEMPRTKVAGGVQGRPTQDGPSRPARQKHRHVVISSTSNVGRRTDRSASRDVQDELLSVLACNSNGCLLDQSQKEGYDLSFLGDNVCVDPVPFLQSWNRIRCSSVTTAIAPGTAPYV